MTESTAPVLREITSALAREAGELIVRGRRAGAGDVATKSSATDLVTEYDHASEELIVSGLRAQRPHDGIIGEEGTSELGTSGIRWLIDPIDGTTNFFYDLPAFAVSIAACDEHDTLAGAVFVPAAGELYSAHRGGGATLNGEPISCSTEPDLSKVLLATGFSYLRDRRMSQMARLQHVIGEVRDIRRIGAASLDMCYAAAGRVDAYFEEHLAPWDLATGELIAREAGCRTGDLHGGRPRPGQALVANPLIFESLRALINAADDLLDRR